MSVDLDKKKILLLASDSGTDFSFRITNATIYHLGKYLCAAATPIFRSYAAIIIGGK
jgi:hypothetical protein